MRKTFFILSHLYKLITAPEHCWKRESEIDRTERNIESIQQNYYSPMLAVSTIILFVVSGNQLTPFSLELAMKTSVAFFVSYFAGLYLALFIIREASKKMFPLLQIEREDMHWLVAYSMSYTILVNLVIRCMPNLKFLSVVLFYLPYIVWCGAEHFLKIDDKPRWKYSLLVSAVIYGSPWIIETILTKMAH